MKKMNIIYSKIKMSKTNIYTFKFFIMCILLTTSINIFAQNDIKKGYIITFENDTIFGKIRIRSNISNSQKCEFYKDGIQKDYKPSEIFAYRVENEKYYISREIELESLKKTVFLEYLLEGVANLYYYKEYDKDYFFIEKDEKLALLSNKMIKYEHEEGYMIEKPSNNYKGALKFLFQDCPEIQNDIKNVDFSYKPLINITQKYHNLTCSEYSCITYAKSMSRKIVFEPYAGIVSSTMKITHVNGKENDVNYLIGCNFIFYPVKNEGNFSFCLGISISKNNYKGIYSYSNDFRDFILSTRYTAIRLPLLIEYNFLKKKITPYINGGIAPTYAILNEAQATTESSLFSRPHIHETEFYNFNLGLVIGTGLKYNINNNSFIKFNLQLEHRIPFGSGLDLFASQRINSAYFSVGYGFRLN